MEALRALIEEVRRADLFVEVLIDGSFVTAKKAPNDVDLVLVVRAGHNFRAELRPDQYNLFSHRHVRRRFGFDILVAEAGDADYVVSTNFFQQVRGLPEKRKGILRLKL